MRLDLSDDRATVTVSVRNALTVLHKLDVAGSARAVVSGNAFLDGRQVEGPIVAITGHEDAEPALNGERGDLVAFRAGAGVTVDCSRSALARLAADAADGRVEADIGVVRLVVESDRRHYADRPDAPGAMSPDTESFLRTAVGQPVRKPERSRYGPPPSLN